MFRTIATTCLLASLFVQDASFGAPIPSQPVHTNRPRFRIPYRYDAAEMQRLQARQIVLYQSVDQGQNWRPVQRVAPQASRFEFRAPVDGEYWFAVRTLDVNNQLHPRGNVIQPGLKVVVDSVQPVLTVNLRETAPGRIELNWKATDTNLDPTKLRLEYRNPGNTKWQMMGVVPKATGRTSWTVTRAGNIAVRGTISDRAGNVGSAQAQINVAKGNAGRDSVPDFRQPIANSNTDNSLSSVDISEEFPSTRSLGTTPPGTPPQTLPGATEMPIAQYPGSGSIATSEPIQTGPALGTSSAGPPVSPVRDSASSRPDVFSGRYSNSNQAAESRNRKRAVQSRRFQLAYKLEDVGPSGVANVELYITQNSGQKWWLYGEDADRRSPFEVEVRDDGEYGFAIRVRSGAGLRNDPPQPGDAPSIVVNVDETAPVVNLLPIQQGQGAAINSVTIRWTYRDENEAELPIHLSYAANLNGPWEPISGWIANQGQHTWKVQPGAPSRIYVRVRARDSAGNMSQVTTPRPIVVDLSRPSARIVDIEAVRSGAAPR